LGAFYTLTAHALLGDPAAPPWVRRARTRIDAIVLAGLALVTAVGMAAIAGIGNPVDPAAPPWQARAEERQTLVGAAAVSVLALYYAAPLATLGRVLRSRDASSVLTPLVAMNLVNGVAWTVYGLALGDPFLWAPNGFGAGLSLFKLGVKAWLTLTGAGPSKGDAGAKRGRPPDLTGTAMLAGTMRAPGRGWGGGGGGGDSDSARPEAIAAIVADGGMAAAAGASEAVTRRGG